MERPINDSAARPQLGLAIAALVLGILSFLLSFMVVGILLGVIGLVLGLVHLHRPDQPRGMAVSGLIISALGIIASIGFGVLYFTAFKATLDSRMNSQALQMWEGVKAPDFTVTSMDGETLTLSELKGKRMVLDIWATWCPPCIKEIPHFNRLREEVSDEELIIIGISKEPPSVIQPFLVKHKVNYMSVSSNALPEPYSAVYAIPTTFFIDRNGVIQTILTGYHNFGVLKKHALATDFQGTVRSSPAP